MSEKEFKEPTGDVTFINPKKLYDDGFTGVVLEGTYVSSLINRFDEAKNDFKFEDDNGKTVIINHNGSLAYKMKNIKPGTYCQVSYLGKELLEKGKMKGKEAHNFKVLIADEA